MSGMGLQVYAIDGVIPVVDPTAFVHPSAVLIGDVIIGPGVYIGPLASLRGDFGGIRIGPGANVQDGCVLHSFPGQEVLIEENGHVGHGAVLHGCVLRHDCLVGMNSVVMDGAEIGAESILAAHAFVKAGMVFPPRSMIVGAPAKLLRPLTDQEVMWKGQGTAEYQRLAVRSRTTMRRCPPLPAVEPDRPKVDAGSIKPKYLRERG